MADKYFATLDAQGNLDLCLIEGVHKIPDGAVPVDHKTWFNLTQERSSLWTWDGNTFVKSPAPVAVPDPELVAAAERQWRSAELYATDGVVARHRDQVEAGATTALLGDQYKELQAYRQALRDWPQSADFPDVQRRPSAPPWIAEQTQ
ncbi:phage tail protein [Pseudomonas protegens]|uniref:phage tail assembly chaperone n=1 Tax=Pseudomonas protegens TaxID=380021 RepID=UPI0015767640|nr:phage tail assembly chaperone [Pseudomonas protegens]NTZ70593.1 phage tail protein [Pseudomonas protegens]WRV92883.1 phage tail assembly chaperone [Pseudomonas protegens]